MRDAFIRAITAAADRDERVMLLTADLGYKLFDAFADSYPGRFLNMGVAEANMVSVAAGLALEGMRPFTYSIAPFATARCLEQIRNDVCMMDLDVIIVGLGAGYAYGANGPTHHGTDDVALMRAMPGMTVVSPCDPREAERAVAALLEAGGPAYLRLGRAGEATLPGTDGAFVLGEPSVLRTGGAATIIAVGGIASEAMRAAETLATNDIECEVLSAHTVKPLDALAQRLAASPDRPVLVVEECGPCGGVFEALAAALANSGIALRRLGAADAFAHESGSQEHMRRAAGLTAENIADAVADMV